MGSQRVAFDITHDLVEIVVRPDRKRFVTPLAHVAHADASPILLPIARMRDAQFLHEGRQLPVLFRPENEVSMINDLA